MLCGGMGQAQNADDEVNQLIQKLEPHIRSQAGDRNVEHVKAVSFKRQVVAGTNYFIKLHLGGDQHAHVRVFKPLPHTGNEPQLVNAVFDKSKEDEIDYI